MPATAGATGDRLESEVVADSCCVKDGTWSRAENGSEVVNGDPVQAQTS